LPDGRGKWQMYNFGAQIRDFHCSFVYPLPCVSWNNKYHMVALTGFGQEYPILVYAFKKTDWTLDKNELKLKDTFG
jgi:hypothetical protein